MTKFKIGHSTEYGRSLRRFMPGGVHYSFRMPWESKQISFVRGLGTRVWDIDSNEYLDFFGKFGANILGHNNAHYNETLIATLHAISATNIGTIEDEVCEAICKHVASAEMVRFSLSGTEAVQNALRLARGYTGRNRFIRFQGHYHGSADNTLGGRMTDLDNPVPHEFQGDFYDTLGKASGIIQDQCFLLPWNDLDALKLVVGRRSEEIAAILMEPICINGGGLLPAPGYLEGVRRLCDEHGVVLIFDEIITGFRVGLRGAQGEFGVTPDLTTLGKALAGGALPVSAIVGRKEIMKLYEDRKVVHGGTFNGYQLGLAAVKATLDILGSNGGEVYDHMNTQMSRLHDIFLSAAAKNDIMLEMRGRPACAVFAPTPAPAGADPRTQMMGQYLNKMIGEAMTENGILVSNANRFYGNIAVHDDDIALFASRIAEVFDQIGVFMAKMQAQPSAA